MEVKHNKLDMNKVNQETYWRQKRMKETLRRAKNFTEDTDRVARLKKQECPWCYYADSKIGGQAITESNCAGCNGHITSGNTNIDMLCSACARILGLCLHCGADIDLKNRRKIPFDKIEYYAPWPEPGIRFPTTKEPQVFLLPLKEK